jgi:hypothetical protein
MSTFSFNVTGVPIDGAQVTIGSLWPIITYVGFKFFMLFKKNSWFLPENIKQAKGNECSQYKRTAAIFSSSLPICPVYFHLVMPRHVLSPCYARYGHTRGMKGYVT